VKTQDKEKKKLKNARFFGKNHI